MSLIYPFGRDDAGAMLNETMGTICMAMTLYKGVLFQKHRYKREYSLGRIGVKRSVDMDPKPAGKVPVSASAALL